MITENTYQLHDHHHYHHSTLQAAHQPASHPACSGCTSAVPVLALALASTLVVLVTTANPASGASPRPVSPQPARPSPRHHKPLNPCAPTACCSRPHARPTSHLAGNLSARELGRQSRPGGEGTTTYTSPRTAALHRPARASEKKKRERGRREEERVKILSTCFAFSLVLPSQTHTYSFFFLHSLGRLAF